MMIERREGGSWEEAMSDRRFRVKNTLTIARGMKTREGGQSSVQMEKVHTLSDIITYYLLQGPSAGFSKG